MIPQSETHSTASDLQQPSWLIRNSDFWKGHLLPVSVYRALTNRWRLKLPSRPVEKFGPPAGEVVLPVMYPISGSKDTPLHDMLALLNLARGRQARRILEIGTFRARTTYALHLNCPEAEIVSYDIQILDSPFRKALLKASKVQLRNASFTGSAEALRKEARFDFIFVDASHRFKDALEDSWLALELLDPNGIVVWHDYRPNDSPFQPEMQVPEALNLVSRKVPVCGMPDTFLAVHAPNPGGGGKSSFTPVPDEEPISPVPPLLMAYRQAKNWFKTDLVPVSIYRRLFRERRRLRLPSRPVEELGPAAGQIKLPALYPLFSEGDTPLNDLLLLFNLAKGRQARRILEIGTHRARITYALHLNCPEATIVSYDTRILDSPYRRALKAANHVQFIQARFSDSANELQKVPPFDLIIINGSHRLEDVIADSKLARERLTEKGLIFWQGYRLNNYYTTEFRVPEALEIIRQSVPVFAIGKGVSFDNECAVFAPSLPFEP